MSSTSKEDNPNWCQAMSGSFVTEYWKVNVPEVEALEVNGVSYVNYRTYNINTIDSTLAFNLK